MLNKIILTNFQRHRHLEVVFNAGISALRGSNEAGKSTLIRAICYALFGAKALPMSLSEAVTWGEPEASLRNSTAKPICRACTTVDMSQLWLM